MTTLDDGPAIRLTDLTDCGGCAAKLGADLLADALCGLGADALAYPDMALIAGLTPPDDAAAYRVSDDLAVIGTVDFFPPLVDDPRTFGEIAAANALSGRVRDGRARPVRAIDRGVPRGAATGRVGRDLRRRSAKVREAGGTLAGGHTIRDPEPKYGLAVIGAGHPDRLLRRAAPRPATRSC